MSGKTAVKASLRTISIATVKRPFEGQRWRWASCSLCVIRQARRKDPMPRRQLFPDEQWASLLAPPREEREIVRHCTLSRDDLDLIARQAQRP
jgi:hypothetical protein